jgi:hypothetical protein
MHAIPDCYGRFLEGLVDVSARVEDNYFASIYFRLRFGASEQVIAKAESVLEL